MQLNQDKIIQNKFEMKKIFLTLIGISIFSCQQSPTKNYEDSTKQELLFPKGNKVPNDKFVGNVYQAILSDDGTRVSNVTFEPNGRTNWHNHPGGQTLLVTDGEDIIRKKENLFKSSKKEMSLKLVKT